MAGRHVPAPVEMDGHVLMLETSEEMPSAVEVYRTLRTWVSVACSDGSRRC